MKEYSLSFWFLIITESFMTMGYAISFPFLAIYLHSIRHINMSIVGFFLSSSMLITSFSNIYGGELSDKIGRKKIMLFSLFSRGVIVFCIAIIIKCELPVIWLFWVHPLGLFLGSLFNPAAKAWVADITPPENRLKAYGIMRIGTNLGWAIGPGIGGLIAISSFSKMFFITATIYLFSAFIIYFTMKDVSLKVIKNNSQNMFSLFEMLKVFENKVFFNFCLFSFLISSVMSQLVVPVSMYAKKYLLFNEKQIGFLFSVNGSMVVALQYLISHYFSRYSVINSLSIGSFLYAIGYFIFGFSEVYYLALFAMVIVTLGELILSPSLNTFAANVAIKDQQGRYLGIASMIHQIGNSFGIFLGSFLIDNFAAYFQQISWIFIFVLGIFAFYGFKKMGDTWNFEFPPLKGVNKKPPSNGGFYQFFIAAGN